VRTTYLKSISEETSPKQVDLELEQLGVVALGAADANQGEAQVSLAGGIIKGIYELKAGHLTYCFALPGKPRPTEFAIPEGSQQTLVKLERFSTGEQETEKAIRAAGADIHNDEVGWITSVVYRNGGNADEIARLSAELNKLGTLYLESDSLTDEGVKYIEGMAHLHSLQLRSTQITDAGC